MEKRLPGGPKSNAPVIEWVFKMPVENASGYKSGKDTMVRTESIVAGGRWMDLKVVGIVAMKNIQHAVLIVAY
jgi:hypothetical protein